jgi:hypothetical protein
MESRSTEDGRQQHVVSFKYTNVSEVHTASIII